jgi:hypothetical protein
MLRHIAANTEKDLILHVPTEVCGIVRTCRLPAQLRKVRLDIDDKPIYSDVQRAFAKVYVANCTYKKDQSQEAKDMFTSVVMAYSRNCYQTALWRLQDALNSRDSRNTSSFYLIGIPMANLDGTQLRTWEVGLAPRTARKLGVAAGKIILMHRYPETSVYPAKVVVVAGLGNHVIGLPVGSLKDSRLRVKDIPTLLGGDCDGDAYAGSVFHTEVCKAELEECFKKYWDGSPEYPIPTGKNYTWKDEMVKVQTDEEIFVSKVWQKLAIGRVTNSGLALFIAKGVMGDALDISYSDIRCVFERMIEVAMDMKKVNGDDPFLMHKLVQAEAVFGEATPAELEKQGYDLMCVLRLLDSLAGQPIRKIASKNTAFRAMLRSMEAVEQLADVIQAEGFASRFVDMLLGNTAIASGDSLDFGYCQLPNKATKGYSLTFTQEDNKLVASCITLSGTAKAEFPTEFEGKVIPLSSISKIIFRETIEVPWTLSDNFTRIGVGKPRMLRSWGEVLGALIRTDFSYDLVELKSCDDLDQANVDLTNLIMKALRRMLTAYEVTNGDMFSWATLAGQQKIVLLDTRIPKARYKKDVVNDPIELEAERRITAGRYLKKMGLITNMSDTISGEPGMAFYKKTSEGRTFSTEQFIIPQFAPVKRAPVANALSNLVNFTGAHPVSFSLGNKPQAATKELYCCVMQKIDLMDGLIVSSALQESYEAHIFEPEHGMYSHHCMEDGSKLQAVEADVKGVARVIPETEMPWIRFADGKTVRAELIFQMGSTSHMQLRQTHFRMALEAVAKTNFDAGKGRMKVPENLTVEQITSACVNSGLYKDDELTVEVLSPDQSTVLGLYPAGVLAVGMHRQIPSIVASVHPQSAIPEDYLPTTTADGGIKNGLAGVMCMKANGLDECIKELHSEIPKALDVEITALLGCIERRK